MKGNLIILMWLKKKTTLPLINSLMINELFKNTEIPKIDFFLLEQNSNYNIVVDVESMCTIIFPFPIVCVHIYCFLVFDWYFKTMFFVEFIF